MAENNYPQGGPANRLPSPNEKYPFVGNNYMQYGEVPGYVYNPWDDQYYLDKGEYTEYLESTGQIEGEPSLTDQLLPVAGSALAVEGGKAIGAAIPGMLGMGGTTAATTAGTAGATTAGAGTAAAGTGAATAGTTAAGTAGTAATGTGTLGSIGSGLAGIAPYAGPIAGAAAVGYGIHNYLKGDDSWDPKDDPMGAIGRGSLALATFGGSEVARMLGIGRHKSTKKYQDERWGKLSQAAQGLRSANHPDGGDGTWKTGKYAGQKWSFEKAVDLAKEDPTHFVGVLGNLETFGDEWLGLPPDVQKKVVSRLVNEGLYKSDKGDVLISNKDRARQIYEEEKTGSAQPTAATPAGSNPNISKNEPYKIPGSQAPASSGGQVPSGLLGVGSKVSSGLSFAPDSAQYNALSKEDKNKYWELRNKGV